MWARRSRYLPRDDTLHPNAVLDHRPAGIHASEVVAQGTDHLVRHPQPSLATSELVCHAEPLRQDSSLSGGPDRTLVLLILLALSALKDQRVHAVVLLQRMTEDPQRPLPRPFLASTLGKRTCYDHKMSRASSSDRLTHLSLGAKYVVPPVEFTALPHIDRELVSKVSSLPIAHPRTKDIDRFRQTGTAHALVAVGDQIHGPPK